MHQNIAYIIFASKTSTEYLVMIFLYVSWLPNQLSALVIF